MRLEVERTRPQGERLKTKRELEVTEVSLIFQAYEENLAGLMRVARQLVDGEISDEAEKAIYERWRNARGMLSEMKDATEKFDTMLMVIENDLLERPRAKGQKGS